MGKMMNPVNWFEIPVNNFERAKRFYSAVLDCELNDYDMGKIKGVGNVKISMFPMDENASGAAGALVKAEGFVPSHAGTLVYMHVDDIESTLNKINANGGKTIISKMSIGEHGFIAHFEDCEGNRVALHSEK